MPPESTAPKPYKLVSLPKNPINKTRPSGHEAFKRQHLSGSISLLLTVKTSTFVASGVVAMGSDLPKLTPKPPLIKLNVTKAENLLIPGSSFKGVVRSIYEAITASCICKTKSRTVANSYKECKDKILLCPACRVFGAMGWQGLISFNDAVAKEIKPSVGFMPSLRSPHPESPLYNTPGRKFYYHASKAVDKGEVKGIPVQQAGKDLIFTTELQFMNLTEAELGTLLIVLGQDNNNKITLKIGGGKPVGMGTMIVEITKIDCPKNLRDRYLSYDVSDSDIFEKDKLSQEIQRLIKLAYSSNLVQTQQLNELKQILAWPTNRQAPQGNY